MITEDQVAGLKLRAERTARVAYNANTQKDATKTVLDALVRTANDFHKGGPVRYVNRGKTIEVRLALAKTILEAFKQASLEGKSTRQALSDVADLL